MCTTGVQWLLGAVGLRVGGRLRNTAFLNWLCGEQLWIFTKRHQLADFTRVSCAVCGRQLNKAVLKTKRKRAGGTAHDFPEPTQNRKKRAASTVSQSSSTVPRGTCPTCLRQTRNNHFIFLIEEKPVLLCCCTYLRDKLACFGSCLDAGGP